MARRKKCLYVPDWLEERMDEHPEVVWSAVFREAAVEVLDELDGVAPPALAATG